MTEDCLFCDKDNPERHRILVENEVAWARWDNFPVSKGHLEVVPLRHVASFFELTETEVTGIYDLLKEARQEVEAVFSPDGYNIGLNEGEAAGRTVHHFHLHLIPRYTGDVDNPRGGIRHIIPGKGNY